MINLPWVDKIREAYNLCVPPNKALYDLYMYGEAEELRIEKDLEQEIEQAYWDMEREFEELDNLDLEPQDFIDDMEPIRVYDVEETEYYE
jgi:hypothetical protein